MKRSLVVVAVLLAALSCACSGGGTKPAAAPGATVSFGGEAEPLAPALQEMLDRVSRVRGLDAPPALKAAIVSRSDLPALLDNLLTADDHRAFAHTTTLYRLLGHLRKDQDFEAVYKSFGRDAVLGLYSPPDKQLWIVAPSGNGASLDDLSRDQKSTLAHELVHAIQDYHYDLTAVYKRVVDDLDWSLASTAVIEGDAVVHERLYGQQYLGLPYGRAVLLAVPTTSADVPASIARELLFPYTSGVEWVTAIRQQQGQDVINRMLGDPPRGSAYILHPNLLGGGFVPAQVALPDLSIFLGSDWKRESGGQWGEFGVRNYLQLRLRGLDATNAAAGWAGDHYDVYTHGNDSVAVFRLRFADSTEASQFAEAQLQLLKAAGAKDTFSGRMTLSETSNGNTTAHIAPMGDEVVFAIGSSREIAERALKALAGA